MSALELLSSMREATTTDSEEHRTIVAYLAKLPKPSADLLRLFNRGGNYLLHGRDAHTVATEYFRSASCVRYAGEDRMPYIAFNKTMGAEIIRTALLTQRRRVKIYAQSGGSWSLDRRGSPGNLQAFEEECLHEGDLTAETSPVIVAVRLGRTAASKGQPGNQPLVGCAFIDCTVRSIRVSEFEDDEHLSTLESMLCQQGARECLLPAELSDADAKRLSAVLELCEVRHGHQRSATRALSRTNEHAHPPPTPFARPLRRPAVPAVPTVSCSGRRTCTHARGVPDVVCSLGVIT
jgi:DNA mismatch repair ATPase MutS